MYKVLIVDDEEFDREGLKRFLNWGELGFEIAGMAKSAGEAMEICEKKRVDIVLTDIVMPEMNGLEMLNEIKKINPEIKAVILSGYEVFQYARESIRLGAYEYLLKPVQFNELKKAFIDMHEILEKEEEFKKEKNKYRDVLKEQFLNNLAKGVYSNYQQVGRLMNETGLKMDFKRFCILRIRITGIFAGIEANPQIYNSENKNKVVELLKNCLDKNGQCYSFNNDIKEMAILYFPDSNIHLTLKNDEMVQTMTDIKNSIRSIIHIGAGGIYSDMLDLKNSYMEAGKALEYCIVKSDNFIGSFAEISGYASGNFVITETVKNMILSFVTQLDTEGLTQFISGIFGEMNSMTNVSMHTYHYTCIEILIIFKKHVYNFTENNADMDNIWNNAFHEILEMDSMQAVNKYMQQFIIMLINLINNLKNKQPSFIVDNAKKYIQEHFFEEITLNKLSEILYVHPTHLSRLFKEKTGENFIDYLIKVRVDKAKELLGDLSYKIYDIAGMIGYESPGYFSRTFKEIVGLTPKEYRDNIAQG